MTRGVATGRGWLCGGWLCGAGRVCHTTHARATFTPSAIPGAYTASYTVHRLGRVTLWSRRGVPTALVVVRRIPFRPPSRNSVMVSAVQSHLSTLNIC